MFVYVTLLLDSLSVLLSAWLGWQLFTPDGAQSVFYVSLSFMTVFLFLFTSSLLGLYQSYRAITDFEWLVKVTLVWLSLLGFTLALLWAMKWSESFSRLWLGSFFLLGWLMSMSWRSSAYFLLRYLRARGYNQKRVVIVGAGELGRSLVRQIQRDKSAGFQVVALFDDDPQKVGRKRYRIPIYSTKELTQWLVSHEVQELWFALPLRAEQRLHELLHELRHTTINLRYVPNLSSLRLLNHAPRQVLGFSMLDLSMSPMSDFSPQLIKWVEDKLLASIMLVVLSPLLLALAIGVKLSSAGPVFYRQQRHGWNGQPFEVVKFRSMVLHQEQNGQVTQAIKGDSRITGFGAFMRRTSLDELPQFINVLKGDMSLVGPRPHAVAHNDYYSEQIDGYMRRHKMKPGITGWAQVNGWRGETDTLDKMQKRVEYDLWYIEHWSLALDIKILLLTLVRFMGKNAR